MGVHRTAAAAVWLWRCLLLRQQLSGKELKVLRLSTVLYVGIRMYVQYYWHCTSMPAVPNTL